MERKAPMTLTDEDLAQFPDCHSHCIRCRQAQCLHPVDNVTACSMTSCQACGFRFHQCKASEHILMCQEERVPCVNSIYGCPHKLKRSNISTHLPVCPASVVSCGEEWCRWPMYTKEKGVKHPLPPFKTYIDCGQLDVGLAMRDQRMLIDSLRAPAKLKRTLRNPLTQKYPAAPISHCSPSFDLSDQIASGDTSQTISDDDTDAPWDLTRRQPGLRESISSHLISVSQGLKKSLMDALNTDTLSLNSSTSSSLSQKQGSLSPPFGIGAKKDVFNATHDDGPSTSNIVQCKITEHAQSVITQRDIENSSPSVPTQTVSNGPTYEGGRERTRSRSVSVLRDLGGSQLHKVLGVRLGDSNEENGHICLHKMLGVSLTHDVINKYVGKPASMYTFICAQYFRRDQFQWHFKNVHEDITSQLDGYLEHRCPLAYAGCSFSFQRLVPNQPDTVLHFSWLQESFGLKSTTKPYYTSSTSSSPSSGELDRDMKAWRGHSPQIDSTTCDMNTNSNDNCSTSFAVSHSAGPSLSDLAKFDRDFDDLTVSVDDRFAQDTPSPSLPLSSSSSKLSDQQQTSSKGKIRTSVQPVVFTACNPDSNLLVVYNVEDESEEQSLECLTDLPFEILQLIARCLDSFSLCNLSLTCRLLRDVCCTLLDDFGIVMLNWERQKDGDKVSWKVANKRWIFSTSFEPITSWRFSDNYMTIADHLKVCPFNQDKLKHSAPLPIIQ